MVKILTRLANRFATGDTIREALDKVVMEKFLQMLPRPAATNIREKVPTTAKEAARLAQCYFQDRNWDPDDQKVMRRGEGRDHRRYHGDQQFKRDRFDRHYGERDGRGRQPRDDRPYQEKTPHHYKQDSPHYKQDPQDSYKKDHTEKKGENKQDDKKPGEKKPEKNGPQCYICEGWGHRKDKCPSRVCFVHSPGTPSRRGSDPWIVSGLINGKSTEDMLLDTGAEVTVVDASFVSKDCYSGKKLAVRGLRPSIVELNKYMP